MLKGVAATLTLGELEAQAADGLRLTPGRFALRSRGAASRVFDDEYERG